MLDAGAARKPFLQRQRPGGDVKAAHTRKISSKASTQSKLAYFAGRKQSARQGLG